MRVLCVLLPALLAHSLPAHPRLILTPQRVASLASLPSSADAFAQLFVARTLAQADAQLLARVASGAPNAREVVQSVYTLGVAHALTGNSSFAARAVDIFLRAAAAPSWDANASVPQLPTGEMLHAVGLAFDSFYSDISVANRSMVVDAIVARLGLIRAALSPSPPPWAVAFVSTHSNWNTVILAGSVIASLAIEGEPGAPAWVPQLRADALANVVAWSGRAWAPAGAWPEGVNYGGYTARYLVPLVESLLSATGDDGGLRDLGVLGAPRWLVASVAPTRPFPELWAYFDARGTPETIASYLAIASWTNDTSAAAGVKQLLVALAPQSPDDDQETTAMNAPLACLYYSPPEGGDALPLVNVFPGPLTATSRSSWTDENATFIGFKGHNTSDLWAHTHLDAASFVYATHGQWFAQELGSDSYTAPGYFSPSRFNVYRTNVSGHNTLSFGGRDPLCKVLATYSSLCPSSPFVTFNNSASNSVMSGAASISVDAFAVVNLTDGFVAAPISGVLRAARGFIVTNSRTSLVTVDEVDVDAGASGLPLWWSIQTVANVSLGTDGPPLATLTTWNVSVAVTVALLNAEECPGAAFYVVPLTFAPPELAAPGASALRLIAHDARLCPRIIMSISVGPVDVNASSVRPLVEWISQGPLWSALPT
jgi:hypothetical protein